MAKLTKARRKPTSVKQTYSEPITCPHCGGQAYLMRRTLHPRSRVRYGRLSARIAVSKPKRANCIAPNNAARLPSAKATMQAVAGGSRLRG